MQQDLEKYGDQFKSIYEAVPQGKVFRLAFDSTLKSLRILTRDYDKFEEIREAFSSQNQQAFFSKQYGYKVEDKKYVINKFGYFPSGLVFEILDWIRIHYGDLSFLSVSKNCLQYINDYWKPLKSQLAGKTFEIVNVAEESGRNSELQKSGRSFQFRDYQKASVEALLFRGFGRGLIEIPTSGGKSFILANFIWNLHKHIDNKLKVMLFVPNVQLVEQFYKDLLDYGYRKENLAKFTGAMKPRERKEQDLQNARIILANRSYVFKNQEALPKIDVLICDEAHQCTAASTLEYIESCPAKIKIGCTGTLPKDKYNFWTLLGAFGKVLYKEEVTKLQSQGFVSKLKITLLDICHREIEENRHYLFHVDSLHKYKPDEEGNSDVLFNEAYAAEQDFYQKRSFELYKPVLEYLNGLEGNILVLFDRIETGKNLFQQTQEIVTLKRAYYIDGQTKIQDREEARSECEKSGDNIIIGNVSILGTGINIKRLNHIVFLCNTKSHSRTIQAIGRVLRLHESKSEAHLVEVRYNFKYSQRHYEERMRMYKETYNKRRPDEILKLEI